MDTVLSLPVLLLTTTLITIVFWIVNKYLAMLVKGDIVFAKLQMIQSDKVSPKEFGIRKQITQIGRTPDRVDILIVDLTVSGVHARIDRIDTGVYKIFDADTTNGTFVNDFIVESEGCPLKNGDVIRLGRIKLKFTTAEEAPSSSPSQNRLVTAVMEDR